MLKAHFFYLVKKVYEKMCIRDSFEGKPESKRYEWTIAHVKAILKSEVYIDVYKRQVFTCLQNTDV